MHNHSCSRSSDSLSPTLRGTYFTDQRGKWAAAVHVLWRAAGRRPIAYSALAAYLDERTISMLTKRLAIFVCLVISVGVAIALASQWDAGRFRHPTARHVRQTVMVSAAGRRLTGFFDGMRPDPRWDARRAAQAVQQMRKCGSGRGLAARLLSLVQPTVYAQGSCTSTGCFGHYNQLAYYSCPSGCSSSTNRVSGNDCSAGAYYDGSQTGCCVDNGGSCAKDSDCCSDYCDVDTGACESEYAPRFGK